MGHRKIVKQCTENYGRLAPRTDYLDNTSKDLMGSLRALLFLILMWQCRSAPFPLERSFAAAFVDLWPFPYQLLRAGASTSGLDVRVGLGEVSYCLAEFEALSGASELAEAQVTLWLKLYANAPTLIVDYGNHLALSQLILETYLTKQDALLKEILSVRAMTLHAEGPHLLAPLSLSFKVLVLTLASLLPKEIFAVAKRQISPSLAEWASSARTLETDAPGLAQMLKEVTELIPLSAQDKNLV